ncbi:MAG: helix-turn-helix domain-containing protein [Nanoarchaeota archaeon]|nr:helix-turn-helix domain-containing protein [Nanoarchaeota archaeon]
MDIPAVLSELGLSEGEAKVYLALLKLGPSPVGVITKKTGQHRTTIYDFLDHLLEKGLVSHSTKEGVKIYKVAHPSRLMDFLKEKEDHLNQIMSELNKLYEYKKEELSIEVYGGKEGHKALLNLYLRTKKTNHVIGFEEIKYEQLDKPMMRRFFKQMKEKKLHEYAIVSDKTKFVYPKSIAPNTHYRYIDDKYFNPNPIMTFGDYVAIHIWEPLTIVVIKSKQLAEGYRKYFKLLWNIAKEKPRTKVF